MKANVINYISKMFYIAFSIFLVLTSCKEVKKSEEIQNGVEVGINLPQKIPVNTNIEGEIIYTSYFDTLKLKENERRYITLYLTMSEKQLRIDELKKIQMDTFVSISDSIIPIYDLKFNKKGKAFLEGYIVDEVYLDETEENFRVKTLETKISHIVTVE